MSKGKVNLTLDEIFSAIERKARSEEDRKNIILDKLIPCFPPEVQKQTRQNLQALGYKLFKLNTSMTDTEKDYLNSLDIDLNKSYLIIGHDKTQLDKFLSDFILRGDFYCDIIQIEQFIDRETSHEVINEDDIGRGYKNLPVIYIHHNLGLMGKQSNFYINKLISFISTRNRESRLTLILSEVDIPELRETDEVNWIFLPSDKLLPSKVRTSLSVLHKVNSQENTESSSNKTITTVSEKVSVGQNRGWEE